jgi:lipooligosaccharide transport system permease protein
MSTLRAAERELRFFTLTWKGQVFTAMIAPILTLVAMGIGLGGLIDGEEAGLGSLDYIEFVTPGLLVGSAVQMGVGGAMWPVMAGHKWLGFHRAMISSPLTPWNVYAGYQLWLTGRTIAVASAFLLAGALLGGVISPWGLVAIPVTAATVVAFTAPVAAFSARADSDLAFDPIIRLVVMPLYLFSGTFFPADEVPLLLQWLAKVFPLWHGVELARASTTGSWSAGLAVNVVVLCVYIAAGAWWGARTFRQRLAA